MSPEFIAGSRERLPDLLRMGPGSPLIRSERRNIADWQSNLYIPGSRPSRPETGIHRSKNNRKLYAWPEATVLQVVEIGEIYSFTRPEPFADQNLLIIFAVPYEIRPYFTAMKKGIHPENYRFVVFKDMSNDEMFITRSTAETKETITYEGQEYPLVKMEISNTSHPFYTGKMKLVDTAGRIDKFRSRYEKKK